TLSKVRLHIKAMEILRKLFQEEFKTERQLGRDEGRDEWRAEGRNEARNEYRKNVFDTLISEGWSKKDAEALMRKVELRNDRNGRITQVV
ncbi:MAG: hypothetical protein IJG62_06995, partial [Synergistaceae bacterium]|nr:hypothetical protein [Synergistaceae bacterium]